MKTGEKGFSLMETLLALGLVSLIAAALLAGMATVARGTIVADQQAAAETLARSQMEALKAAPYVTGAVSYSPAPLPSDTEYSGYAVNVTAAPLHTPDDGLQKVTVTISKNSRQIMALAGYKVNR